jgi:hypothetical protein
MHRQTLLLLSQQMAVGRFAGTKTCWSEALMSIGDADSPKMIVSSSKKSIEEIFAGLR